MLTPSWRIMNEWILETSASVASVLTSSQGLIVAAKARACQPLAVFESPCGNRITCWQKYSDETVETTLVRLWGTRGTCIFNRDLDSYEIKTMIDGFSHDSEDCRLKQITLNHSKILEEKLPSEFHDKEHTEVL